MYTRVIIWSSSPLNKADINSLDFVINQFFIKLFCTRDIYIVRECQLMFNFKLPSEQLEKRKKNFIRKYMYDVMNCYELHYFSFYYVMNNHDKRVK